MGETQNIDLQKLSQRELLIVTYRKVEELTVSVKELAGKQEQHEVKLAVVDTKVKLWAAIIGAVTAFAVEIVAQIIKLS